MSTKKGKTIYVDHLTIHAKNIEIVDPDNVVINRKHQTDTHEEEHFPRRDPWGFFWGRQMREDENKLNEENSQESSSERE
ncbi:hypothetical protein ACQYAD_08440 [Neobacillus sp. SM06]|uniref:hypothetical protein n=1 Tax=Neobacillus sp. SM06 TaxID=3422492 RepID=UPI003D2DEA70